MKLFIFARFHAREGKEHALEALLRAQLEPVRAEPGCLEMGVYRSVRDPRLFWIHSRWADEAAFDLHARLPNTDRFVECAEQLIDHPFDVTRSQASSAPQKSAAARSLAKAAKISSRPSLSAATALSMLSPEVGFSAV